MDQEIADLLYEARSLKHVPRSGFQYLGAGKESVAEHTFMVMFITHVMARLCPEADELRLLRMSLLHDLPEARMGDLNAVQKKYVSANEDKAVSDLMRDHSQGSLLADLIVEFREGDTLEAQLARDADQLSLLLDLKALCDIGYCSPEKWIDHVRNRMITTVGKDISAAILNTQWDHWWYKDF